MINLYFGAIFDLDGTIIDSNWVWNEVDEEFKKEVGINMNSDYGDKISHMTPTQAAEYTIAEYDLKMTTQEIKGRWLKRAAQLYEKEVTIKPGADKLLKELEKRDIKIALATSCFESLAIDTLKKHGVNSHFSAMRFTDKSGNNKESAHVYLECANDLKLSNDRCVVFEDIITPLKAVKEEDMGFIAVSDLKQSEDVKKQLKISADEFIENFDDFIESKKFDMFFNKKVNL